MNREAALLGIPVYSIFTGPIGAIDLQLSREGRLHLVRAIEDVTCIKVEKREIPEIKGMIAGLKERSRCLVVSIVDAIIDEAR